jgi:gliding motility-associated-like protein
MKKHYLNLLILILFTSALSQVKAHSVQLGYCTSCNGDLRIWVEHWHTTSNPNSTTMTLQLNVNSVITNITGSPNASVLNTTIGNLPGCFTPLNVFASCPGTGYGSANYHNDWVAYDFNGLPCGVPISVTIISGNTAFTADGCGMMPASTGTIIIPCATNQLPNIDTCAGNPVGPFNFPASNTWTNSNPAIGLPASGTGNIPQFTAANTSTTQVATITVSNNCGTSTFNITIYPAPQSSFTAQVGCPGQPVTFTENSTSLGGPITNWSWDFGDGSPIYNGQNPPPHTYAPPGPYNVTLTTTTANGCTHDTTIVVDPLSGLVANFVAPSVCAGSPTLFTDMSTPTGNIINWGWDFDNNGTVDDINQNPSHTFPGPGTYNVELWVKGVGGCVDSIVIPVVVNPNPVANFTGTNECFGTTTTFNDLSTILTGTITNWFWDFGDPNVTSDTSNLQNPTYTYPAPGTYNVTLTITSDSGCTGTFTTTVEVYSHPVANFTPNTACAGANSIFNDISTLGSIGIQFWNWDFDNDQIVDDNNQNPSHLFPGLGNYPVNLHIVDSNGCFHDTTIMVSVSAQPTAAFTFTNECYGTATSFTDLSNPNGGTINAWDWDFDNNGTVDNVLQNPTNGYASAGTYTVELLVTTTNGCKDSITMQVVVNPIPVANFSVAPVCLGTPSVFYDSSSVITGSITNWQWDFGDALGTSNAQNPTYTYAAAGTYAVTLTVTSDSGCIHTYIDSAVVSPMPTAAFTTNNVCLNTAASFTDTSNPNGGTITSWEWDFNGDNITDDVNQHPTNFFPAAGVYNVQLIVSSAAGCADTIVNPITIHPMPTAAFTFNNECFGTAIGFTDNSAVATGNITNWNWDFGNLNTSTLQNPSENYAAEGVYTVQLIVTTDNGCKDTISHQVEVYPIPVVNFTPTDVCLNFATQFNDLTTVSNTYTTNNIVNWYWDFGDGLGTSNLQNPTYTYNMEGVYQAYLVVTSNHGCTDSLMLNVTVNPLPQISFDAPTDGCAPVCMTFVNNSNITSGLISTWAWDFGDGNTASAMNPSHCFENNSHSSVSTFDITLTGTSDKGCVTTLMQPSMITAYPMPLANFTFGPQPTDIYDKEITFVDQSIVGSVWTWDLGDGASSTQQNPIHEYADSGTFVVTLFMENQYGCKDTAQKTVVIKPTYAIWIPNTFTPDGDGNNDFFFVKGYGIVELQTLVFDRWGVLLYEGYLLDSKWNGSYKGNMSIEDTYVYKVRARDVFNEWHEYIGKITLLK